MKSSSEKVRIWRIKAFKMKGENCIVTSEIPGIVGKQTSVSTGNTQHSNCAKGSRCGKDSTEEGGPACLCTLHHRGQEGCMHLEARPLLCPSSV